MYPALHRMEEAGWIRARMITTEHNCRPAPTRSRPPDADSSDVERERWRSITTAVNHVSSTHRGLCMSWLSRLANAFRPSSVIARWTRKPPSISSAGSTSSSPQGCPRRRLRPRPDARSGIITTS